MSLLFTASEVGSARALLPLCCNCLERSVPFYVVDRGFFSTIDDPLLRERFLSGPDVGGQVDRLLNDGTISVVIFSVNVKDTLPLLIARKAASIGMPTIHVLDFWNGYRSRMELDEHEMFVPSVYAVPDNFAADLAAEEGIDPDIIKIMGQPAFHDAEDCCLRASRSPDPEIVGLLEKAGNKKTLMFVSEPVSLDQGESSDDNPNYRGYTEKDAISILIRSLENSGEGDNYYLFALPHPREDPVRLKKLWKDLGGERFGSVVEGIRGRNLLPHSAGVVGMSSTLLYEAWLVGAPVLSIQPEMANMSMWMMEYRQGVELISSRDGALQKTDTWLEGLNECGGHQLRDDIRLHDDAPARLVNLALELAGRH